MNSRSKFQIDSSDNWVSEVVDILKPFIIDVFLELAGVSLAVALDDAFEGLRVVFVHNLAIVLLEQIGLQLESSRQLVGNDDVADLQHFLVDLRVVREELFGGIVVTKGLVCVQLSKEG